MVLAGGGPFPSQHRVQRTIREREPKDSLWEVSEHCFQVAFIIKRAWETQNHQILLLNLCLRMHEMCTPRQRDAESPSCALRSLCLRLHEMCTLRQRDSESPCSVLGSLSQTARNVHSETERLRITKSSISRTLLWEIIEKALDSFRELRFFVDGGVGKTNCGNGTTGTLQLQGFTDWLTDWMTDWLPTWFKLWKAFNFHKNMPTWFTLSLPFNFHFFFLILFLVLSSDSLLSSWNPRAF